jgi:undecaprenyl diphosphate synthase
MSPSKLGRSLSPASLKASGQIPRHVAIIMDGNGRWAAKRGVPRLWGHREGRKGVREAVEAALELGVEVLTLYTFSKENWERPKREVGGLMRFLMRTLREEVDELDRGGVRLRTIGRIQDLPVEVRRAVRDAVRRLSGNRKLLLQLALSYSGREEILVAVRKLVAEAREKESGSVRVDAKSFSRHLDTAGLPDPDLLIRTSGEMRLSNFLLWQVAYTEFWVTDTLWPDFKRRHFYAAVADYQQRERRFGRTD